MKVALVVAVARNGVIGRDGDLPWRLSSDLKLFRRITMDRPIIMGRRTWSSLKKKPLDGRDNIVVTRDHDFKAPGARVAHTIEAALEIAREAAAMRRVDEIMVIGGAEIYKAVLPFSDRLYWTHVEADPDGDTYFPSFDKDAWKEVSREDIPRGPRDEFAAQLVVLDRVGGDR